MAELRALDARGEIGERRMDWRFARLTMHLVACWRSAGSGPVRLDDFRLRTIDEDEPAEPDAAEVLRRFDRQAGAAWTR